jgi:DNA-directed RNA polymerase I, II, and III subunit RPABC2
MSDSESENSDGYNSDSSIQKKITKKIKKTPNILEIKNLDDSDIDYESESSDSEEEEEEDIEGGAKKVNFEEDDVSIIDEDNDDDIHIDEEESTNKEKKEKEKKKKNKSKKNMEEEEIDFELEEEDDEDDEYNEKYLQKFNNEITKSYIHDFHPECITHNYDEIQHLSHVIRDSDNIIIDPFHKTNPYLSKYEYTRIIGQRAKQIETGSKPFIQVPENVIEGSVIAELELKQKRIPFIIRRPIPNGGCEYWNIKDLEFIHF